MFPAKAEKEVDRSRLSTAATVVLVGGIFYNLGFGGLLKLLLSGDRAAYSTKIGLREYLKTIEQFVTPPPLLELGILSPTEARLSLERMELSRGAPNSQEVDIHALAYYGKTQLASGSFLYHNATTQGVHQVELGIHGRLTNSAIDLAQETEPSTLEGVKPIEPKDPQAIGMVSLDSLPNIIPNSIARSASDGISSDMVYRCDPANLQIVEKEYLSLFLNEWFPGAPTHCLLVANDIPFLPSDSIPYSALAIEGGLHSVVDLKQSLSAFSTALLIRAGLYGTIATLRAAGNNQKAVAETQVPPVPHMSRRQFLKYAGMGAAATGIGLTGVTGARFGKTAYDATEMAKAIAWSYYLPFKVQNREPKDYFGRVLAFLNQEESAIPPIAYYFFVRDLISTYKEKKIVESASYHNADQPNTLSLWGNMHDTKIGLFAVSSSVLLEKIQQAVENYPNLFAQCFLNPDLLPYRQTLYSSAIYHAKALGEKKHWTILEADLWVFEELRSLLPQHLL